MIAREALTLEGAWCVGTDAIVTHVPGLTLIHICRARGGVGVRGPGWRQSCRPLLPFPTPALGMEVRAEAGRAQEKHRTLTPLPSGTPCPGAQARCCQGPWPYLIPKGVGLPLLCSSSQTRVIFLHPLFPYCPGLPLTSALILSPPAMAPVLPVSVMLPACLSSQEGKEPGCLLRTCCSTVLSWRRLMLPTPQAPSRPWRCPWPYASLHSLFYGSQHPPS